MSEAAQPSIAVQILAGPFKGNVGIVCDIDQAAGILKVRVSMFGKKQTTIKIDVRQVRRIPAQEMCFYDWSR